MPPLLPLITFANAHLRRAISHFAMPDASPLYDRQLLMCHFDNDMMILFSRLLSRSLLGEETSQIGNIDLIFADMPMPQSRM